MRGEFIDHQFNFPPLVIGTHEVHRRGGCRGAEGGDQPMDFTVPRACWVSYGVDNDTDQNRLCPLVPLGGAHDQACEVGPVWQFAHPAGFDMGGQAPQDMGTPCLHGTDQIGVVEATIPEQEHAWADRAQQPPTTLSLTVMAGPEAGIDNRVSA